jgi:hypothetical protein
MELHLEPTQVDILHEVLDAAWRDLRFEIADTDNAVFKSGLRDRAQVLRSLLDQMSAETASSPS